MCYLRPPVLGTPSFPLALSLHQEGEPRPDPEPVHQHPGPQGVGPHARLLAAGAQDGRLANDLFMCLCGVCVKI